MEPVRTIGTELSLKSLVFKMYIEVNRLQSEVAKLSSPKSELAIGDLTISASDDGNLQFSNGSTSCTFDFENKQLTWSE